MICFFCISNNIFSQKESNNWFFGFNAGLNFNGPNPIAASGGKVNTTECSASISDSLGELLFYTNGTSVFDRNHNQMPNGFGLLSNASSTQGALIIKKPDSKNLYYIFNIDAFCVSSFVYSIVDMNLNGGFGDVIEKNNEIFSKGNYFEKISAVKHCNNKDYWIIILGRDSTTLKLDLNGAPSIPDNSLPVNLYCFLLNSYGIVNFPIITTIGNLETAVCYGQMKCDSRGQRIVFGNDKGYSILGFNKENGLISSVKETIEPIESSYGLEFSENGKLLYVNTYQIDLNSGNKISIQKPVFSQFQMASNHKIYFINNDSLIGYSSQWEGYYGPFGNKKYLSSIDNPNIIGTGCNINSNNTFLGNYAAIGLPNLPSFYFYHPKGEFTSTKACAGSPITFQLLNNPVFDSIKWLFIEDGIVSYSVNPTHIYNTPGTFHIKNIIFNNGVIDTTQQCITIDGKYNSIFNKSDTVICNGKQILLGVTYPYTGEYKWNTGETSAGIYVKEEGNYWVTVTNKCASYDDTITIKKEFCDPELFLPNIFSPNGDGINDNFIVELKSCKKLDYSIYDRWGSVLKRGSEDDLGNNYFHKLILWDGNSKNLPFNEGVFFYVLDVISINNKVFRKSGFITLVR